VHTIMVLQKRAVLGIGTPKLLVFPLNFESKEDLNMLQKYTIPQSSNINLS